MSSLHLGTAQQFAELHALLKDSGFTEDELCRQVGIENTNAWESVADAADIPVTGTTSALFQLFVAGRYLHEHHALQHFGASLLETMATLGLVQRDPQQSSQLFAPVALYPIEDIIVASDRWNSPDRGLFHIPTDVVYPAIVSNTRRFLKWMPRVKCERLLDLGSGTGVGALLAARGFAGQVFATDIAERSTLFCEWNRQLNNIENLTARTGSFYDSVPDLSFNRIVTHPPYVPTLRPSWTYFDGGPDGEAIVKTAVTELPRYLESGGIFYMLTTGSDRRQQPFEHRVRSWLGDQHNQFDIALLQLRLEDPDDFAVRSSLKSPSPESDLQAYRQLFVQGEVEQLVYGAVLIQRFAGDRPPFTVRRQRGPDTSVQQLLSMLHWEATAAGPNMTEHVLRSRLKPNPGTELHIRHRWTQEGWEPAEQVLRAEFPFAMEAHIDSWAPFLLALCDGERTSLELFHHLQAEGALPETGRPEEFAMALSILVSGGFLLMDAENDSSQR